MTLLVSRGGVTVRDGYGLWLEEYPDTPSSHVLNGAMFALFGVYDLVRVTGDADAADVLSQAARTLALSLPRYQRSGAILYQLTGENYAFDYEIIHLKQLRALGAFPGLAGAVTFRSTAALWASSFRSYPLPKIAPAQGTPCSSAASCRRPLPSARW